MKAMCAAVPARARVCVCVCVCASGGGRRKTEHEKPMDRRFKGAGHAIYTKRGERDLAYKVS